MCCLDGTDNLVDLSVYKLKVKLSKHYLPFLTLRTLPDTYPGVKVSPGKPQLPDPTQVQSHPLSRSQEPVELLSCSGLRREGLMHCTWVNLQGQQTSLMHVTPGLGILWGIIYSLYYYLE